MHNTDTDTQVHTVCRYVHIVSSQGGPLVVDTGTTEKNTVSVADISRSHLKPVKKICHHMYPKIN